MTDMTVDALLAAAAVTVPPIESDPAWQAIQATHTPIEEEVMPFDCIYGECDHDTAGDCPPVTMTVCSVCVGEPYDGDIETLVKWPCELAPVPQNTEEAER